MEMSSIGLLQCFMKPGKNSIFPLFWLAQELSSEPQRLQDTALATRPVPSKSVNVPFFSHLAKEGSLLLKSLKFCVCRRNILSRFHTLEKTSDTVINTPSVRLKIPQREKLLKILTPRKRNYFWCVLPKTQNVRLEDVTPRKPSLVNLPKPF